MNQINGVFAAIVTPFNAQNQVSTADLTAQVRRQKQYGNNIFCNGTNGEFFAQTNAEKLKVVETCVTAAAGDVTVMTNIGCVSTEETIQLGKTIERMGVAAVSVITPWFASLRPADLITHFRKVADALTIPVYLYNIPARTTNTITPEIAAELARHPNIHGIKDSAGSYESLHNFHLVGQQNDNFHVLTGPDSLILRGFQEGSVGCISGIANIIPEQVHRVYTAQQQGDAKTADDTQNFINALRSELYSLAFSPAVVKQCVNLIGYSVGNNRASIEFTESDNHQLKTILHNFKLI